MDSRKRDVSRFFPEFSTYLLFIEQWRKVLSFPELAIWLQFNERGWFLREIKDEVYSLGSGKRPAVYGVRTRMVYYQRAFFRIVWSHLHFNLGSFPLGEKRCWEEKYHAKFFSLALLSSIIRDLLGTYLYWLKNGKKGEETRETRDSTRNGTSRGGHAPFSRLIGVTVAPFPLINSYRKFLRGVHEIRYRDFRLPATTGPLACPHENLPSRSVSVIADAACTPQLLVIADFFPISFPPPFGFWKGYRAKDDTSKRF